MNVLSSVKEVNASKVNLLREIKRFDENFYRQKIDLSDDVDVVTHYLDKGWRMGLEPCEEFAGQFLLPYYQACGYDNAPALTWAELALLGSPLPATIAEIEHVAHQVRKSPFFDAEYYAHRLPQGLDPAVHYAVIGERLGWCPSLRFNPIFYLDCYPDIHTAGVSPLLHYSSHGHGEGRMAVPVADKLDFPSLPEDDRPVILLISHEASRTGAPVLGWNIIRKLALRYRVVSFLMHEGTLEDDFAQVAAAQVGPITRANWNPIEMRWVADRIVREYSPLFAINNSIETYLMVPPLEELGVPSIALVHEFAAYTRPISKMLDVYNYASHIIFPSDIVAQSSYKAFPNLQYRSGLHIMAQGISELPPKLSSEEDGQDDTLLSLMRPKGYEDAFIVLGAGAVQIRKGVDLFIATAAKLRMLRPDLSFRFVWMGHGYNPEHDNAYSVYLAAQIEQASLGESFAILDAVEDMEPAYANADAFFMCSRLDPQPNVGIDAVTRGIPTVCFKGSSGTAEVLQSNDATRGLVAPYLDVHAAAKIICHLANNRAERPVLSEAVSTVGARFYKMDRYIHHIEELGLEASSQDHREDLALVLDAGIVDPEMAIAANCPIPYEGLERSVIRRGLLFGAVPDAMRRPFAGFHPQCYRKLCQTTYSARQHDPLSHWLRAGRPDGPWLHPVFSPDDTQICKASSLRVALHGHFFYPDLAKEFRIRLQRNETTVDLFLSTNTDEKAECLQDIFRNYGGKVSVGVVPNKGRDIGPFLTESGPMMKMDGYDLIGHIHGKKSLCVGEDIGADWRNFLWENLIGGTFPMIDFIAEIFDKNPAMGVVMAEDPNLISWGENREFAMDLAQRMGLNTPLDDFFDFPVGTMFWARSKALSPLLDLQLEWSDYPDEPVPYDGTILHALERLVPFSVRHVGLELGAVHVPGTNR